MRNTLSNDTSHMRVRHCQMIVVGEPRSGKTSLLRAVAGKTFIEDLASTDGVDITVTTSLNLANKASDEEPLLQTTQTDIIVPQDLASRVGDSLRDQPSSPDGLLDCKSSSSKREASHGKNDGASLLSRAGSNIDEFQAYLRDSFNVPEDTVQYLRSLLDKLDPVEDVAFVRCLDCGGQLSFSTTQSVCFGAPDRVYALTFDVSQNLDSKTKPSPCLETSVSSLPFSHLDYILHWLQAIAMTAGCLDDQVAGRPCVLLIGTHADKVDNEALFEGASECIDSHISDELKKKLNIRGPFFTDNRSVLTPLSDGGKKLMADIHHELSAAIWQSLPHSVPPVAVKLEILIRELREPQRWLTRQQFAKLYATLCPTGRGLSTGLEKTLLYIRKTGSILFHGNLGEDGIIYLNIEWLAHAADHAAEHIRHEESL